MMAKETDRSLASQHRSLLYLSREDVESVRLPMTDMIERVEAVFVEKGAGRTEMPPKPGIHPAKDAFIHAMPAYIPGMRAAGMKWVSGYPENQARGLPYISGLLILNDPDTGVPICVMDCTWITAMRTAAASAVAAKYLCDSSAEVLAVVACGVQGRSHVEALGQVLPKLSEVRAFDTDRSVAERFAADLTSARLAVRVAQSVEAAVTGADAIVTSGPILKSPEPALAVDWVEPSAFISAVDFDSYLRPEVFARAARLFTDDLSQFDYYKQAGYFQHTPRPEGDISDLVSGKRPPREPGSGLAIAVNLGIALEDMAVAVEILERAERLGLGTRLAL